MKSGDRVLRFYQKIADSVKEGRGGIYKLDLVVDFVKDALKTIVHDAQKFGLIVYHKKSMYCHPKTIDF